jgi:non-ribosomal peptide synthase protein (TIGR01720 family)
LLLIAHHAVADPVSWRLLLDDLQRGWSQVSNGQGVSLGEKSVTFRVWAEQLQKYGMSSEVQNQRAYWINIQSLRRALPVRAVAPGGRHSLTATLSREDTERLLRDANVAYRTTVEELLLAGLAPVLEEWLGARQNVIEIEGHGREQIVGGLDLSRTVGWFTTLYPFVLENAKDEPETIISVKEALRAVPGKGTGYAFSRDLSQQSAEPPGIVFNYLGQFQQSQNSAPWLRISPNPWGTEPAARLKIHPLAIACFVHQDELQVCWDCDDRLLDRQRTKMLSEGFIASLRAVIEHCCSPHAGAVTPSDVASFRFSRDEFDEISSAIEQGIAG